MIVYNLFELGRPSCNRRSTRPIQLLNAFIMKTIKQLICFYFKFKIRIHHCRRCFITDNDLWVETLYIRLDWQRLIGEDLVYKATVSEDLIHKARHDHHNLRSNASSMAFHCRYHFSSPLLLSLLHFQFNVYVYICLMLMYMYVQFMVYVYVCIVLCKYMYVYIYFLL